jgi:hypothetical protein
MVVRMFLDGMVVSAATAGDFLNLLQFPFGQQRQGALYWLAVAGKYPDAALGQSIEHASAHAFYKHHGIDIGRHGLATAPCRIRTGDQTGFTIDNQQGRGRAKIGGELGCESLLVRYRKTYFHGFSFCDAFIGLMVCGFLSPGSIIRLPLDMRG